MHTRMKFGQILVWTSSYFHVTGPGAAVAPNVCVLRVCAQVVAVKCGDDEGAQGVPWGT